MVVGQRRGRQLMMIYLLLVPSLIVFLLYRLIPLGWNVVLSLHDYKMVGPNVWVGLANYLEMFRSDVFWESVENTVVYFFVGSPIAIVLALIVAVFVNNPLRGRNVYRVIVFLPYPITPAAIAIIWQWLFNEKVGLINFILRSFGILEKGIPFLGSTEWALPAVITTSIWQVLGYFVILILTGLQTIPDDLYECAELDGAGPMNRFFRITVPLIRPTLFICFVVAIINSFTVFDMIYVMTGGGPAHASEILITNIYKNAFTFTRLGYAAAMTFFMFVFLLVITWIGNRLSGGEAGGVHYYE